MKKYLINKFSYILAIFMLSILQFVHAQQFDNSYLKWKAQQQEQDSKLKQNPDSNYYLSKPSVKTASLTKNTATSSQKNTNKTAFSSSTKISLNTASVEQLQQLNGVGMKKAQAIVEYRNQNGKFKNVSDLENVKGIGPKLVEKNKAVLVL